MNDDIVKTLLESLTDEQKAELIQGLITTPEIKPNQEENKEEVVSSKDKDQEKNVEKPKDKNDFTMNRNPTTNKGRKEVVKFKKNTWKDDGDEFSDIETPKITRTPRNRKKPNMELVECHVCGREFEINANLIYGEYQRCNKCGGK